MSQDTEGTFVVACVAHGHIVLTPRVPCRRPKAVAHFVHPMKGRLLLNLPRLIFHKFSKTQSILKK